ncbi:MAG: RES family NAD+ phosphorylase [Desulfobacteraceae bacterium]|nr:RES family NAD+ phosphorylase [Desulfobacteraceae bacterium]
MDKSFSYFNIDFIDNSDDFLNSLRFQELIEVIKHKSRFIIQEPYKSFVDLIIQLIQQQFISTISVDTILYRARINRINFSNGDDENNPFAPEEMGPPPEYLTKSGRINPEGIPYLYCAGELDTAAAELRPWKGAKITIGEVKMKQAITIADLTLECRDKNQYLLFDEFSNIFSMQWPPELKLNYIVTQYFAEHFKSIGLRGIKYKSEFNIGGNNYSLFFTDDYEIFRTYVVEASDISYFFYKSKTA